MPQTPRTAPILILACAVLTLADAGPRGTVPESDGPEARAGRPPHLRGEPGPFPSDWFGLQRAFPGTTIPQQKYRAALERTLFEQARNALGTSGAAATWTQAGPFNIGGRATAIATPPGGATVYLGSANGGVFKSVNAGVNWTPVFDATGVFSIGALALDPTDPGIVYVGTGEANASVDSYDGAGVFRSVNGGLAWESLGLAETARIARIAVDPADPQRIFVAAMGTQFSTGPDRGLYRSENGGTSWSRVLFVNDSTGVSDVVIHPAHPETVYCATWERIRRPTYRRAYGPGCGIWRSADHGQTWTRLAGGLPAPNDDVGRIGLAIAPSRPSTIYAQITSGANLGYGGLGMYRTLDGGETWTRRDASGFTNIFGGFSWYFGDMAVDPADPEQVYALGVQLVRSVNGGVNFSVITGNAHVDQHGLWIDPLNPSHLYLANDGGFYSTSTGGSPWFKSVDLPITQFYAATIDASNPTRLLGGTQDNNTLVTSGSPSGWSAILGGDGFYCLVHPTGPDTIFAEFQFCCSGTGPRRSSNNGGVFVAPSGIVPSDRFNWSTPFTMSPADPNVVIVGSHRVYKSADNGRTYAPVSGDLTTQPVASLTYGTISTVDISAADPSLYYVGTDDGKVWRSDDAGGGWIDISAGLPVRWVTRVTADPLHAGVVYVTLSGFGLDESLAHVYRSDDRGATWSSIAGNLPDVPANDLVVDPADPNWLYLATDTGVWATSNLGGAWFPLGAGLPVQTVFDLTLHPVSRTLVAATHGRSQWRLDLTSLTVAAGSPAFPPARFSLSAPMPNPSRGAVQLALELSRASAVDAVVYDATGRRVRGLARRAFEPGRHVLAWDGSDVAGRPVEPGVYFVRVAGAGRSAVARIVRSR